VTTVTAVEYRGDVRFIAGSDRLGVYKFGARRVMTSEKTLTLIRTVEGVSAVVQE